MKSRKEKPIIAILYKGITEHIVLPMPTTTQDEMKETEENVYVKQCPLN